MKKDGIADKVSRELHRAYDHILKEGVKPEEQRLLDALK